MPSCPRLHLHPQTLRCALHRRRPLLWQLHLRRLLRGCSLPSCAAPWLCKSIVLDNNGHVESPRAPCCRPNQEWGWQEEAVTAIGKPMGGWQ